jgi:hypothetical protein
VTPGHLKAYLADGTFIIRTAAGQALAISIAGTEAGLITFDPKFSSSPRAR